MSTIAVISKKYPSALTLQIPIVNIYTSMSVAFTLVFLSLPFLGLVIGFKLVFLALIIVPVAMLGSSLMGLYKNKTRAKEEMILNYISLGITSLYFLFIVSLSTVMVGMFIVYTYILR